MRIVIAAGGTYGHLNPSFVIADELKRRGHEVFYVTLLKNKSDKFLEYSDVLYVDIKSLNRKKVYKNISSFFHNNKVIKEIGKYVDSINPKVVISFGASVGTLTIKSVKNKNIKTVIHEQNAVMGFGNRLVYKKVDEVLLTMECGKEGNIIGNPVITDFYEKFSNEIYNNNILIVCGTNGAEYINNFFIDNFKLFNDYNITIITGHKYYNKNKEKIKKISSQKFLIKDFEKNIIKEYNKASVVICRSGSGTLSEIMGLRKLAITIPSPNVSDNHHYYNAKCYNDLECLEMIEEDNLNIEIIKEKINKVLNNRNKYIENIKKTQNVYSKYLFIDVVEGLLSEE